MAYPSLGYTPPNGTRIDLNDGETTFLLRISGTGAAPMQLYTADTPTRHGASYLGMRYGERVVIGNVLVKGSGYADTASKRQQILASLNPIAGLGTVDYTPLPFGTKYVLPGIPFGGLGFDENAESGAGVSHEILPIAFRCPDPIWRESNTSQVNISVVQSGTNVPTDVPTDVLASGANATITNTGTAETWPYIEVTTTAGYSGYTVTNHTTNKKIHLRDLVVTAGQVLRIDMDKRTITLDGANVSHMMTAESAHWPLVLGSNTVSATVDSGSAESVIQYVTRMVGV